MADLSQIRPYAEVVGADGVHVGTVDHLSGDRLKLTRKDSVDGRHHFIDGGLVDGVIDGKVQLSANAAVAITFEEVDPDEVAEEARLESALEETFPASDPVSAKHIT